MSRLFLITIFLHISLENILTHFKIFDLHNVFFCIKEIFSLSINDFRFQRKIIFFFGLNLIKLYYLVEFRNIAIFYVTEHVCLSFLVKPSGKSFFKVICLQMAISLLMLHPKSFS